MICFQLIHEVSLDDRYEYARGICYWVENDPVPWVTLTGIVILISFFLQ